MLAFQSLLVLDPSGFNALLNDRRGAVVERYELTTGVVSKRQHVQ